MFDDIYWKFIDPRFYGPFTTLEARLGLLSSDERSKIDAFSEMKINQESKGDLASYYTIDELVDI